MEAVSGARCGLRLRPERDEDLEFLFDVYASTREDVEQVPWDEATKAAFLRLQFNAQRAHYTASFPDARFDVIEVDDDRVGRLCVDRRPGEIAVIDIALMPAARGRGIGGALLCDLIDEARAMGRTVSLHVETGNRARGLYERLGFVEVSTDGFHTLMRCDPAQLKMA